MDEIISYKMCAVKVRNAKLRNYLKGSFNSFTKNILKRFAKLLWLNFTLNWSLYYV